MATLIRAKLSETNKYWVEKHRYYELKHFCLQYPFWERLYLELDGFRGNGLDPTGSRSNTPSDPTSRFAEERNLYFERMDLIRRTAYETDPDLATYIFKAVTEGLSFNHLKAKLEMPCGRDMYYDRYRRFFWLLDLARI